MDGCSFSDLPHDLLSEMADLESLTMIYTNGYRTKIWIIDGFFAKNTRLKFVKIRESRNLDLDPGLFNQLESLEVLDLANNNFYAVPLLRPQVISQHICIRHILVTLHLVYWQDVPSYQLFPRGTTNLYERMSNLDLNVMCHSCSLTITLYQLDFQYVAFNL